MTLNSFEDNLVNWFLRKTASTAVRRVADLPAVVASSVGIVRKENQDRVAVFRFADIAGCEYVLVVLCDGMGGMADGATCAAIAIASFSAAIIGNANRLHLERTLFDAALTANQRVYDRYRGVGGATLSALLILPNHDERYWVNIGDSRIHEFHASGLKQLTVDDTLAGQLARESEPYFGRNELLQFIGMGAMAEPHISKEERKIEDFSYLITSDGVHFLPPNMIRELLQHAAEPAIAARRLIDLAMWCGGHDNASLAIASFARESWNGLPPIQLDAVEVWDPYGDARFFGISRYYHRRHSNVSKIRIDWHESAEGQQLPEVDLEKTEQKESVKDKQLPRRKKALKKKEEADSTTDKPVDVVPQLTINFRKKD